MKQDPPLRRRLMYNDKQRRRSDATPDVERCNTRRTRSNPNPSLDESSSVPTNPMPTPGFSAFASQLPPFTCLPTTSTTPFPHLGQQSEQQPSFTPFHLQAPSTFVEQPSVGTQGSADPSSGIFSHLLNCF